MCSQGRGKTEWPRHGLREPRLDLGPAPVVQRMSREDRLSSFRKLERGPMEPSANGLSWSLIIQGLDSSMPALGHNSELVGSTKKRCRGGTETCPGCSQSSTSKMPSARLANVQHAGVPRSEQVWLLRLGSAPLQSCGATGGVQGQQAWPLVSGVLV